jgi:Zn-finger nucleic acid-binding protein
MTCPRCNTQLIATDRQGVEIDHCPVCRGIWLDRGELDALIDKTTQAMFNRSNEFVYHDPYKRSFTSHHEDDDKYEHVGGYDYNSQNRGKKKGFLSELFDF